MIGTLLHLSRGRQETSELVVLSHASKLVITLIENVSLKTLLSHVETKKELTAYLSQKFVEACEQAGKKYVVVYENLSRFNVPVSSEVTGGGTYSADTAIAVPLLKVVRLIM